MGAGNEFFKDINNPNGEDIRTFYSDRLFNDIRAGGPAWAKSRFVDVVIDCFDNDLWDANIEYSDHDDPAFTAGFRSFASVLCTINEYWAVVWADNENTQAIGVVTLIDEEHIADMVKEANDEILNLAVDSEREFAVERALIDVYKKAFEYNRDEYEKELMEFIFKQYDAGLRFRSGPWTSGYVKNLIDDAEKSPEEVD